MTPFQTNVEIDGQHLVENEKSSFLEVLRRNWKQIAVYGTGVFLLLSIVFIVLVLYSTQEFNQTWNSSTFCFFSAESEDVQESSATTIGNVFPLATATNVTRILVIGGDDDAESSMEMYHPFNPEHNHELTVKMIQKRDAHTSALMDDGTVITVGVFHGRTPLSHCERFTPSTSTVTQCASLDTPRAGHGSAVLDGVLHICGGWNDGTYLQSCEQLISNIWEYSVSMNRKRSGLVITTLTGYLYAIGGYDGSDQSSSVERRRASDDHWSYVKSMNHKRSGHSAAAINGKLFVCGGYDGGISFSTCEQYDPIENEWVYVQQMHNGRSGFGMVTDGKYIFALGGGYTPPSSYKTVEMYDWKNDTWTKLNDLIYDRDMSSAVILP